MVDVDGGLAAFVPAYADLASRLTGKEVPREATRWDWTDEALTPEETQEVWKYIGTHPSWWHTHLSEEVGALDALQVLNALSTTHNIFFVTNRPHNAKSWTEAWLQDRGYTLPTVITVRRGNKGKVCQGLDADLAIDDRPENCLELYRHLPMEARVYLLARPWNTHFQGEWGGEKPDRDGGIRVTTSLLELLQGEVLRAPAPQGVKA